MGISVSRDQRRRAQWQAIHGRVRAVVRPRSRGRVWEVQLSLGGRLSRAGRVSELGRPGSTAGGGGTHRFVREQRRSLGETPEVARAEVILALSNRGISDVEVNCASRNELTGPFIIECEFTQDIESKSDYFAQEEFPLFS